LEGEFDTLVSIGITTDRAGLLTVDTTKLNQALEADVDQVAEIFLGKGRSTDNNIRFANFTEETKAGSYNVNLTAAAEQATVSGSGIISSSSGINADEILTFTDLGSNRTAEVLLSAGDQIDEIVSKINSELRSRISEVHTSDVGNVATSGSVITRDTTFGDIAGANVQTGDTIKINGTSHDGRSVSTTYTITATNTMDDFLSTIENLHNNEVSVAIDSAGKLVVTDQVAGDSDLAISIEARNEGNGSLGFGTLTASTVGRSRLYVNASNDGGQLKLTHENYGTDYGFRVLSNRSIGGSTGIGTISVEDFGVDVAGTIDGETATGDGRYLTGDEGNTNTGGLRVQASLTVAELTTQGAAQGAIHTTFGFAEQIDRLMDSFLDSVNGSLTRRVKSFTNEDKSIQSQIDRIELRLEQVEFRYKNMFLAMERAISQFNSQGSFLSNQLSIMNNSQWGQNR
jgi:flagellar hook-associated protein 2